LLIMLGIIGELGVGIKVTSINGVLRSKNAELRIKSDQLVALLHGETERLKELAESEHLARVKLEKQIQPRTIDESERIEIGEELKKFAPSLKGRKVKISSQTGDAEGMLFSLEIMDILNRSGIYVDAAGMGAIIQIHAVEVGTIVTGPPADQEFIRSLVGELNAKLRTDFGTSVYGEWNPKYTEIAIMVGVKPIIGLPKIPKDWKHQP